MIHLLPSFKLDEQKTELIFMLDRSGSMMGGSIDLAKKALSVPILRFMRLSRNISSCSTFLLAIPAFNACRLLLQCDRIRFHV